MSLLEPLNTVIAAIDRAADELAREIQGTISASDSEGLEDKARVARKLIELRLGAQSLVVELSPTGIGSMSESPEKVEATPQSEIQYGDTDLIQMTLPSAHDIENVEFTPAEVYGRFILLAVDLLGGTARYRDAQAVMLDLMKFERILKPADLSCTIGTTRPRFLAQSSSHRITLVRRKLLVNAGGGADAITDVGRAHLSAWLDSRGLQRGDYLLELASSMVDLYYHLPNYTMALWVIGGRAWDAEVLDLMDRLQKRFPILGQKLSLVEGRPISSTHLETFSKEKFVKVYPNGEVMLTNAGTEIAMAQLHGSGIPKKAFRSSLPRTKRARSFESRS